MTNDYLECPICKSNNFFIRVKDKGLMFFNVFKDYTVNPSSSAKIKLKIDSSDIIECTQCSWSGTTQDLV